MSHQTATRRTALRPAGLALANYRDPDRTRGELVGPWKP